MPKSSRLPSLEEYEQRLESRRDAVRKGKTAAEELITRLKAEIDDVRDTFRRTSTMGMVDVLVETMEAVSEIISDMSKGQEMLIDGIGNDLSDLVGDMGRVDTSIDRLSNEMDAVRTAVEDVNREVSQHLKRMVSEINHQSTMATAHLSGKLDTRPRVEGVQLDLSGLQSAISQLSRDMQELKQDATPRLLNLTVTDRDEDGNIESVEIQATRTRH